MVAPSLGPGHGEVKTPTFFNCHWFVAFYG